jgi:XisI protein
MAAVDRYRRIVEQVLMANSRTPPSVGEIQLQTVFDRDNDHYLLVQVGWGRQKRIYGTLAHVDLLGEKAWIQQDGLQEGLANLLREAGIPAEDIVLGYRIPESRPHTGYAVA